MSTRVTRGRKRQRAKDNDNDINNNNNKNKNKKQKTNNNTNNKRLQLIDLSEYFCCVCKELSSGKILQCPNGCVICESCYPKINPCKCPLCRVAMNRNKPIRCRIAERTLALRFVKCKYDGCNKEITFSKLKEHELTECEFKPINCKYNILGCKWKGLRHEQKDHESECECDQNQSLQIVQDLYTKLKMYQQFCRECSNIHCDSIWISSDGEFETHGEEFYYEGYEYVMRIKSTKKQFRRGNQDIYEIYAKIVFAEDNDNWDIGENIDVDIGIIIEPHGSDEEHGEVNLMKQIKVTMNRERTESEWELFEQQLKVEQYKNIFRGGFDVRLFCFCEDESI